VLLLTGQGLACFEIYR